MSSYIDIQNNNNFNTFLKDENNKNLSKKEIKSKVLDKDNSIDLKQNDKHSLTTEEILKLYKNISEI